MNKRNQSKYPTRKAEQEKSVEILHTPTTLASNKNNQTENITPSNSCTSKQRSSSVAAPEYSLELLEKRILSDVSAVIKEQLSELEDRLTSTLNSALADFRAQMGNLRNEVNALQHEVASMTNELDDLRRQLRLNDVVIRGIPVCSNEKPNSILRSISNIIDHDLSPHTTTFRTQSSKSSILITKFSSNNEQKKFLEKFSKHGKLTLRDLNIGFTSDSRIYVNESLTPKNTAIFRAALKLRRQQVLSSVFTRDGYVYIKKTYSDQAKRITNFFDLPNMSADALATGDD